MNFVEKLYINHKKNMNDLIKTQDSEKKALSWFDKSSVDYWSHLRIYEMATILRTDKGASWFTIGDGRFGLDPIRFKEYRKQLHVV